MRGGHINVTHQLQKIVNDEDKLFTDYAKNNAECLPLLLQLGKSVKKLKKSNEMYKLARVFVFEAELILKPHESKHGGYESLLPKKDELQWKFFALLGFNIVEAFRANNQKKLIELQGTLCQLELHFEEENLAKWEDTYRALKRLFNEALKQILPEEEREKDQKESFFDPPPPCLTTQKKLTELELYELSYLELLELLRELSENFNTAQPVYKAMEKLGQHAEELLGIYYYNDEAFYSISPTEGIKWKQSMILALQALYALQAAKEQYGLNGNNDVFQKASAEFLKAINQLKQHNRQLAWEEWTPHWQQFFGALAMLTGILLALTNTPLFIGVSLAVGGTFALFYNDKQSIRPELGNLANTISNKNNQPTLTY